MPIARFAGVSAFSKFLRIMGEGAILAILVFVAARFCFCKFRRVLVGLAQLCVVGVVIKNGFRHK